MTRKDYQLLAGVMKEWVTVPNDTASNIVTYALTDALQNAYPNFDRVKFLTACGVQDKALIEKKKRNISKEIAVALHV